MKLGRAGGIYDCRVSRRCLHALILVHWLERSAWDAWEAAEPPACTHHVAAGACIYGPPLAQHGVMLCRLCASAQHTHCCSHRGTFSSRGNAAAVAASAGMQQQHVARGQLFFALASCCDLRLCCVVTEQLAHANCAVWWLLPRALKRSCAAGGRGKQ